MDILTPVFAGLGILICLTVIVTIHEAGHFLAARWAGVDVEAFAIGWGKVLWAWKPGRTEYRICLLPLGGYCKMKGEQDLAKALEQKDGSFEPSEGSLFGAPPWKRILISLAGPASNLLFAFVLFFCLQASGYPLFGPPARIQLASEVDGRSSTPAELAGLRTGDLVLSVGKEKVNTFADLQQAIAANGPRSAVWNLDRGGEILSLTVVPRYDDVEKRPIVGIYPDEEPIVATVEHGSIAAFGGLRPGDKILAVDGQPVASSAAFFWKADKNTSKDQTQTVSRGGN